MPIARDDLVEQAKSLVGKWGPWFGRRDLIPPADDPRTKLIDRALVTHGLLSPEQLAEIHQVGEEVERLRPSEATRLHLGQVAGQTAVQADREARARLNAEKKAAAAERKRLRAGNIARRRAEDIVFLGCGVSSWLGDRVSDEQRLTALGLPILSTPADLARALGITIPRLRWLAFHAEVASRVHYVYFTVPKKSGGQRTLSAPQRSLANAQRWILNHILSRLPVEPAAHGFVAGRGTLTNARPHVGKSVVLNCDLADFFPSITFSRIRGVFHRLGYSRAVSTIFALLCTECPRTTVTFEGKPWHVAVGPRSLPQGACTSPALSNQAARRLDRRLAGVAGKLGFAYTRYADDLTFSGGSDDDTKVGYLLARVRHIVEDEGFVVNSAKTRVHRRNTAQMVTGLVVNERPNLRRKDLRRLRAILHHARREGLERQNRASYPHFETWLRGMLSYVRMVRPDLGAAMLRELDELTSRRS